jgi:hypothetical protein
MEKKERKNYKKLRNKLVNNQLSTKEKIVNIFL